MMQNCADCCILNSVFAQSHPLSVVKPVTENWNGIFILLLYYTNFFDILIIIPLSTSKVAKETRLSQLQKSNLNTTLDTI